MIVADMLPIPRGFRLRARQNTSVTAWFPSPCRPVLGEELDPWDCVQQGAPPIPTRTRSRSMITAVMIQPLVALVAGILILMMPRLLNYIVAIYLIIVGLAGLLPQLGHPPG